MKVGKVAANSAVEQQALQHGVGLEPA